MSGMAGTRVRWSSAVGEAGWIRGRLTEFDGGTATSVVPEGFAAYARVLHPVTVGTGAGQDGEAVPVRWRQVAAWSGAELTPQAQFHDIALPEHAPPGPAPWEGDGPQEGTLSAADGAVLAELLRAYTDTPEECWFCLWDGFGWDTAVRFGFEADDTGAVAEGSVTRGAVGEGDPVPEAVRAGPRVELPYREYLLHTGAVEQALAFVPEQGQTANLWWPRDRAWCVGSEIDLPFTYVGGSRELIDRLTADPRLEAQRVEPSHSHLVKLHGWLATAVERAVGELLATGTATLATPYATLTAHLRCPTRLRRGVLRIGTTGGGAPAGPGLAGPEADFGFDGDSGESETYLERGDGTVDRDEIVDALTCALTDLAHA